MLVCRPSPGSHVCLQVDSLLVGGSSTSALRQAGLRRFGSKGSRVALVNPAASSIRLTAERARRCGPVLWSRRPTRCEALVYREASHGRRAVGAHVPVLWLGERGSSRAEAAADVPAVLTQEGSGGGLDQSSPQRGWRASRCIWALCSCRRQLSLGWPRGTRTVTG